MTRVKKCFEKPCRRCGKTFRPASRTTKLCDECRLEATKKARKKKE